MDCCSLCWPRIEWLSGASVWWYLPDERKLSIGRGVVGVGVGIAIGWQQTHTVTAVVWQPLHAPWTSLHGVHTACVGSTHMLR